MEEKYLTRQETAERLNVHVNTVDYMVKTGKLQKFKRGADHLSFYRAEDVEDLLRLKPAV